MRKITLLPPDVSQKIAAGEVIERPFSAVKELVENSLDAGASDIKVELQSGGKKLIRVTDNGHGMNREDALLCFEMEFDPEPFVAGIDEAVGVAPVTVHIRNAFWNAPVREKNSHLVK